MKGNRRNLTGTVEYKDSSYYFILKEPGDDKWDGIFTFKYEPNTNTLTGEWVANNGKSTKKFTLTK